MATPNSRGDMPLVSRTSLVVINQLGRGKYKLAMAPCVRTMAAFDQPGLEQQKTQGRLVWSNKAHFHGPIVLDSAIQALNLARSIQ